MSKNIVLNSKSAQIKHLLENDKKFRTLYEMVGDISYEPADDCYEFLVYTIIGQMISNKVADILDKRFFDLCEGDICAKKVDSLTVEQMRGLGLSYSKANYIKNLTNAVMTSELDFERMEKMSDDEIIKEITKIKGLGKWSAKMFLIFVLNRENVVPHEDGAFSQAYFWLYGESADVKEMAKKWAPYSSIVARYLYKAHDKVFKKNILAK